MSRLSFPRPAAFLTALGFPALAVSLALVDPNLAPDLFVWSDTCNVYVVRDGDAALLINLGDGSVLDRTFKTNHTFTWHGREFLCLDTPGNSPGGMSYLLKRGDRWLAFSGNLMLGGANTHTWFETGLSKFSEARFHTPTQRGGGRLFCRDFQGGSADDDRRVPS